jgi:hypothetical protein
METSIWAIAISIVIGVAANLLTPHFSKFLGNISGSIKKRNERRKVVFANSVQYLIDNPHEEIVFRILYMQSLIGDGLLLFFSLVMMFSNNTLELITGFILSLLAYYAIARINNRRKIMEELNKRKKSAAPDIDLN